jgi:hypothetical protein
VRTGLVVDLEAKPVRRVPRHLAVVDERSWLAHLGERVGVDEPGAIAGEEGGP